MTHARLSDTPRAICVMVACVLLFIACWPVAAAFVLQGGPKQAETTPTLLAMGFEVWFAGRAAHFLWKRHRRKVVGNEFRTGAFWVTTAAFVGLLFLWPFMVMH